MIKNVYNDVLGMTVEEAEHSGLSFEDIKKLLTVNITTPNEDNIELYYAPIKSGNGDDCIYSYQISQNDNYTFKATNSKGRSCEITVPVNDYIKTFTLEITKNGSQTVTETKTFSFIEGQTWEEFIGESNKMIIDGVEFKCNYDDIRVSLNSTIGYYKTQIKIASLNLNTIKIGEVDNRPILHIKNGENKTKVLPSDKIVANGVYCMVSQDK